MTAPERIFARIDTATVYMDGSSPLIARTREFRGGVEYVRADIADDLLAMLKVAQLWLDVDGRFDMQAINAAISKAESHPNG